MMKCRSLSVNMGINTPAYIFQGGSRPVYKFHFTSWPDNEVPELTTSLLDFRRKVRSYDSDAKGPLIVHCRLYDSMTPRKCGCDLKLLTFKLTFWPFPVELPSGEHKASSMIGHHWFA